MEYIEDYDEQAQQLCKKIEKFFKQSVTAEAIHTQGLLDSVKKGIKELKEVLTYYKSDMY